MVYSRLILHVLNAKNTPSFVEWCREYNKEYKSIIEEEIAYKNYVNNIERVEALNKLYKER